MIDTDTGPPLVANGGKGSGLFWRHFLNSEI